MTDSAPLRRTLAPLDEHPRWPDVGVTTPAERALEPSLPRLRLLLPPACEPPYDDEAVGAPALRLVTYAPLRQRLPAEPEVAPLRRRLSVGPEVAPLPSGDQLRPARPFAIALVRRLIEVRGGMRPVLQLQRDTTPRLYADLEQALHRRGRTAGARPGSSDVRSVHVQERPEGVAEVCATVTRGVDRMGALALRLENVGGRWLCTQVQGL